MGRCFAFLESRFQFWDFSSIRKYSMRDRGVASFANRLRQNFSVVFWKPFWEFVYTGGLGNLNIFHYFKNFLFWSTLIVKHLRDNKIRVIKKTDSRLYLFEGSGSLARKDSANFEKKSLKLLTFFLCHILMTCYYQLH